MQSNLTKRFLAASPRELDAKLELLQQLGYHSRFYSEDDLPQSANPVYVNHDTDRWIQTEYNWALEEAAESAAGIPDLFDVEEDEEACLPNTYDPTLFAARQRLASPLRSRSQSLLDTDKPLPTVPPLRLRPRPSLPIVPPPSSAQRSLSSPASSPPVSPRVLHHSPPPSPRLASSPKSRTFPRSQGSPSTLSRRPSQQRHATYPSISSTLSLLEERETDAEKRSAVYLPEADEPSPQHRHIPIGRGRSSSATVPSTSDPGGPFSISSSPRRRHRPALPALSTSASSPQLRKLAELATIPSPAFSVASPLLPSPMSDVTVTPETDTEIVTPGEAITYPPWDGPEQETSAEPGLASRWSLDSVASRPRITQMTLDDGSASPASKTRKRDRLLSLISSRTRSGSVTKPLPPPNTPRGSSDVLDIRHIDSRDSPSSTSSNANLTTLHTHLHTHSHSRPLFSTPPKISMAPSLASNSSNGSSASTLATPIEPLYSAPLPDFTDPFATDAPSCVPESSESVSGSVEAEGSPVFAENPYIAPDSPLMLPDSPPLPPSPEPLRLQIPPEVDRPASPESPPPQPTLPLPSPSTPSPSFLVPTPRPQSFFASITGRQKRRKKKLVISGAPLEIQLQSPIGNGRTGSGSPNVMMRSSSDDLGMRQAEQRRRVQNVVKWCESFGPVRKIETKEGKLHVYWKDWEVADMVCRVQAQVVIKDVGRVNLAWYYIS